MNGRRRLHMDTSVTLCLNSCKNQVIKTFKHICRMQEKIETDGLMQRDVTPVAPFTNMV